MSPEATLDSPTDFAEKAVSLLKEYLTKLHDLQRQFRALRGEYRAAKEAGDQSESAELQRVVRAEFQALEFYYNGLWPALQQFSQQVSGMIDQGRVPPIARSELRLRLAELESTTSRMVPLIAAYRPQ